MRRALILAALVASAAFYFYFFRRGLSARAQPLAIESFVAGKLRRLSIPASAASLRSPLAATALMLAQARDHYADHCAVCHGNRGEGGTTIARGLYPPVPDLRAEATQSLSDGELLYVIDNGVRFTGMPGWGGGESEENWKLVAFIRHLPSLTDEEALLVSEVSGVSEEAVP